MTAEHGVRPFSDSRQLALRSNIWPWPLGVALWIGTCAAAASAPGEYDWRSMAAADLDAAHTIIVEAHPGAIDPRNPTFNAWVERGYREAKAHLPYVVSYDTALAAVRYYTAGFEDGHLAYSDDIRKGFPVIVTGWNIAEAHGRYIVDSTIPGWKAPLPPVGAEWLGCDGESAEGVLQKRVGPFVSRQRGADGARLRVRMLWARRPVAHDLQTCSFRLTDGKTVTLRVSYAQIAETQLFDVLFAGNSGSGPAGNTAEVLGDVLWVHAGNFTPRPGSGDQAELEALLKQLKSARGFRAVVFDARGNLGGDSGIGDQIFEAATGGLESTARTSSRFRAFTRSGACPTT